MFCLRRLFLAVIIGFVPISVAQFLAIQLSSVIVLSYFLILRPFETPTYNVFQILNEVFIYMAAVVIVLFSEYVVVTEARWLYGYAYIGLTVTCIVMNLLITLIIAIFGAKNALRKRKAIKQALK